MPTLSFVMTYNNRPEQLRNTLTVLQRYVHPGDQIVVVDDASQPELCARRVLNEFKLPVDLSEIQPERKRWINPCIPYNMGFQMARCDATVIMNSECIPMNGAIDHLRMQVRSNNYVVMPCYSTTESQFRTLCQVRSAIYPQEAFAQVVMPLKKEQWYHHPNHLPTYYHFTTCLMTSSLRTLGGFNEEFANGYCFEDNEFLFRVRKLLKVEGWGESCGWVIHQWHPKNGKFHGGCPEWIRNQNLWNAIREGRG